MNRTLSVRLAATMSMGAMGIPVVGQATFQGLGILPGFESSCALSVSGDGRVVVGASDVPVPWSTAGAFRWTAEDGMEPTQYLFPGGDQSACAVNSDGSEITGMATGYKPTVGAAYRLTAGGITDIGLPPGQPDALAGALGISGDGSTIVGVIAVRAVFDTYDFHAMRWTAQGGMTLLEEPYGGNQMFGWARDASSDGTVTVGWVNPGPNPGGACRWDINGKAHLLPPIPGGGYSEAFSVSADGQTIVGTGYDANGVYRAVQWTDAGPQVLDDEDGAGGLAYGVSADGSVVVGTAWKPQLDAHAFVWNPATGVRDLNEVLAEQGLDLDGWVLRSAECVSSDGRTIVGWGDNPDGRIEGWIVRLVGLCYADFNGDASNDLFDFLAFVNAFNAADLKADCNEDGVLDLFDFLCFTNAFNEGCK